MKTASGQVRSGQEGEHVSDQVMAVRVRSGQVRL